MVRSVLRSVLLLALMTSVAAAGAVATETVAQLTAADTQIVLDSTGDLQITRSKKPTEHVKLPALATKAQAH